MPFSWPVSASGRAPGLRLVERAYAIGRGDGGACASTFHLTSMRAATTGGLVESGAVKRVPQWGIRVGYSDRMRHCACGGRSGRPLGARLNPYPRLANL